MELTPTQKFDATIRAAAAGDVCVCCFRLMLPGASVTMVRRELRQPGRPSPFGRVPDGHASVAVPVCLDCTLSGDIEHRRQGLRRCKGCGRVMRHFPSAYGTSFPPVCSWACAYIVKLARSKVVRRVERELRHGLSWPFRRQCSFVGRRMSSKTRSHKTSGLRSPARAPPLAEDSLPAPVAARARVRPLGHEALAASVTDFRKVFHAPHNLRARELNDVRAGPRANARKVRPRGAGEMAHHAPAALAAA